MSADSPILRLRGLGKDYRGAGRDVRVAVEGVDLDMYPGESVAIVGESGSGKSTTARMIVGLETPSRGTLEIDGRAIPSRRLGYREQSWRSTQVQMVFQDPQQSLDRRQSIGGCLEEVLALRGQARGEQRAGRVRELLGHVGLEERHASALPRELSGGQRQRVAIARALAANPRVLVLDEAVSALDVTVQAQILSLLRRIRAQDGVSLVFISHDLAVVGDISERVLVMRHGRVVEEGPTARVLYSPSHDYTRLLLASVPRPGWTPRRAHDRGDDPNQAPSSPPL